MKINLEINAPTNEEFAELVFTLLHGAYGISPDDCKTTWELMPGTDEGQIVRAHYVQVATTLRDMLLSYYKAGAEAGMTAAQLGGPMESQN